jgi:hypothetical protein
MGEAKASRGLKPAVHIGAGERVATFAVCGRSKSNVAANAQSIVRSAAQANA